MAVVSSLSPLGTAAAWSDFAPFREVTIYAGGPDFSVIGFEDLHQHDYTNDNLTDEATIVVMNRGDVTLQHFEASIAQRVDEGSNSSLYDRVNWEFTRTVGGVTQTTNWSGWASWLSDLTLAPGASASYGVRTTLDPTGLDPNQGEFAVTEITVLARISSSWSANDTAWSIVSGTGIVQYVHLAAPPEIEVDTSNARWENPENGYDLHLLWDAPPFPFGPAFTIYINGIAQNAPGETWYYYNNRYQLGPAKVMATFGQPGALRATAPAVGEIVPITVEVRASGTDWVARKTLWAVGVAGSSVLIYGINPAAPRSSSAAAPVIAFAAPAPATAPPASAPPASESAAAQPISPSAAPQATTPGAETQKEQPEAEAPAAPAAEVPAPHSPAPEESEAAPPVPAQPAPTAPTEVSTDESAQSVELDWPSGETVESAKVDDEEIDVELADGVLRLALPETFWEGAREVVVTGKVGGADATRTIRLTRHGDGEITYELVEPTTEESS
ncbi:hypothetical protein GCM10022286_19580 [Gryllotalpicola daejeonensis]|uniref:Uncharacterized protein n=1 Tax=Gryllotalpicola daejeonensis TaxID=993087 RepID=A0ABP7ZKI3_9MICO